MTPRYELFKWLDMEKFEPVYGVRLRERGRWLYMGERGLPCVTYSPKREYVDVPADRE